MSPIRYIDAHNHLQDQRLYGRHAELLSECATRGVISSFVNGACPEDWPLVASLAQAHPSIIPSFGVHPWYINDLPFNWREQLIAHLDSMPSGVGEVGIDGWRKEFDSALQERIFIEQLVLAAERNLPLSIHGLRRWGRLHHILATYPRPQCGFLLHSYGGPVELIKPFVKLGGYFSCPGFFFNAGREMKLKVFAAVPRDRLLLETDAPDQNLPEECDRYRITKPGEDGIRVNHPANITVVYEKMAQFLGVPIEKLSEEIESNFSAFCSPILAARA